MEFVAPTTLEVQKSLRSLNKNPRQLKTEAPPALVGELEDDLLGLGASGHHS